ncbi:hypothetical protein HF324_07820 [Chitinophaga oryzae]|uniref:Uncharacterized protein n=1 Tax=Chitinophaga oryzae TaxID=2725414 RepID=A0AAE7D6L5_9BACT|nr:hypothetical protein [Chitinophaga oryzae]QJB31275.1 hypothetical protein HF329_08155 [Chitinophaga oryzae]QJB37762.1 hypothetical protein HF324_07820 [Chitinophaga oryzae]
MKPFVYKFFMVACVTGILCILLFACNSSREASREADSAAATVPRVDSTSVIPVDTTATKPDTTRQ